MKQIEALEGVVGTIIGRSYGGKSLGRNSRTGSVRVQRQTRGGLKAVMQSAKGLQEVFVRTEAGCEESVQRAIREMEQ